MPALQARCLRCAFELQVHVVQGEELVGGGPRHRVHEDRLVTRLRQSSLAAVARAECQHRAEAVVVRCLQTEAPHVGVPWQILVRGSTIAGGRPRRGTQPVPRPRDMKNSPLVRGVAGSRPRSMNKVRCRLDQNIEQRCCDKRELGRNARDGPLQTWHARISPGTLSRSCSALGTRQETQ